MGRELTQFVWSVARALGTERHPDALLVQVDVAVLFFQHQVLGQRAGKEGAMEDGEFVMPRGIGDGEGEHGGVLVVDAVEVDALVGLEGRETESLPVQDVLGDRQRDSRAVGRERRVGHDVPLQRLDEGDAGVLAPTAVRSKFVGRSRARARCRGARCRRARHCRRTARGRCRFESSCPSRRVRGKR